MDLVKVRRSFLYSMIFAGILLICMLAYGDVFALIDSIKQFDMYKLPIILLIMPINFLVRFFKFQYYLKLLNIYIPFYDRLIIYLSGLCMSITPAKLGEVIRPYMIRHKYEVPMNITFPMMIMERITDGLGMILIAVLCFGAFNYGLNAIMIVLGILIFIIAVIQNRKLCFFILDKMGKIKFLQNQIYKLEELYKSAYSLIKVKPLFAGIMTGVIAWTCEGFVLYLTVEGFGGSIGLSQSFFIVSFSAILGAVSMLPGGLFAADGSIVALLALAGLNNTMSTSVALISRFSTLWMGVFVGAVFLFIGNRRGLL